MTNQLIPAQHKGGKTDINEEVSFKTSEEATRFFQVAKRRLQDINKWHEMAGALTAEFTLTDANGSAVTRLVETGDYFKIKIPAPGPDAGEGYDWVRVELIEDKGDDKGEEEIFGIRVRPASQPGNEDKNTAHFFNESATSSFIVKRKGRKVKASVQGRNEVPNTKTDQPLDKARNAIVGLGAIMGFSNPQWKSVVEGVMNYKL